MSTAVMGTRDVLVDQQGCLVASEDINEFAEKVVKVLANVSLQQQLAQAGKIYANKWTALRYAGKLTECYQALIENASGCKPESVLESVTTTI